MKRRIRMKVKNENFKKTYKLLEKKNIEHDVVDCSSKVTIFSVVTTKESEVKIVEKIKSDQNWR